MTNVVDAASSATTSPAAEASESATPATSAPTIASIDEGRQLIDDIDIRIRALVATRKDLSAQVQALRAAAGGPRVEHGRENAIITAWADELGPRGAEIALAVLTLCRGNLP
ncbi:chorismate mutase [Frankia sp. CcI49]|uniref:Chorismate mutase n=1 Tax=Parafrankia irregularis TaxID=795642 RepID=A0A0S4R1A8_9ACTN|nr:MULTISPECIES: chorismate mutase [Frankiaceae]KPM57421.1 chorismate mutase [Frankia sp. R43]MBE3205159.1 chorismate mutase [Parafrankia sp. CH37]ONH53591.1 chorismate mutase [Frankia sp. CcI49]CUU61166.1 chorismate mutase [Parafrankia irregularis]